MFEARSHMRRRREGRGKSRAALTETGRSTVSEVEAKEDMLAKIRPFKWLRPLQVLEPDCRIWSKIHVLNSPCSFLGPRFACVHSLCSRPLYV